MSGYIGNIPTPQATQTRDTFTATASQTTFATSGYTPSFLDVFLNGVHLVNGTDYTATNGSDVVLTSGAAAGDTLEVVAYSTYQVNSQNYTGGLTVDNDGATVLTVDRATSDGAIIDLQKDGASVGSVGARFSGRSYIASGSSSNTGIRFDTNFIAPADATGANRDAALNIGSSGSRFKDLYLSGGVYLGGTGSANYLDDYEEGTWTVDFRSDGGTTGTQTTSSSYAYYRKVGSVVFVQFSWLGTLSGYSGVLNIFGLPFSPTLSTPRTGNFECASTTATASNGSNFTFFVLSGGYLYPRFTTGQSVGYLFNGSTQINGLTAMRGSATYITSA